MSFCFSVSGHVRSGSPGKYVSQNVSMPKTRLNYSHRHEKHPYEHPPLTHICLIQLRCSFSLHITPPTLLWVFSETDDLSSPLSLAPANVPWPGLLNRPSSFQQLTSSPLTCVQGQSTPSVCYICCASTVSCQVGWFNGGSSEEKFRSKSSH